MGLLEGDYGIESQQGVRGRFADPSIFPETDASARPGTFVPGEICLLVQVRRVHGP